MESGGLVQYFNKATMGRVAVLGLMAMLLCTNDTPAHGPIVIPLESQRAGFALRAIFTKATTLPDGIVAGEVIDGVPWGYSYLARPDAQQAVTQYLLHDTRLVGYAVVALYRDAREVTQAYAATTFEITEAAKLSGDRVTKIPALGKQALAISARGVLPGTQLVFIRCRAVIAISITGELADTSSIVSFAQAIDTRLEALVCQTHHVLGHEHVSSQQKQQISWQRSVSTEMLMPADLTAQFVAVSYLDVLCKCFTIWQGAMEQLHEDVSSEQIIASIGRVAYAQERLTRMTVPPSLMSTHTAACALLQSAMDALDAVAAGRGAPAIREMSEQLTIFQMEMYRLARRVGLIHVHNFNTPQGC